MLIIFKQFFVIIALTFWLAGIPARDQYLSKTLMGLLQQCGVEQSFSASARPLDNAVVKTFFALFKREEASRKQQASLFDKNVRKAVPV